MNGSLLPISLSSHNYGFDNPWYSNGSGYDSPSESLKEPASSSFDGYGLDDFAMSKFLNGKEKELMAFNAVIER